MKSTELRPSQARITIAATLAVVFAGALFAVAAVISVDAVTHHGAIGSSARDTVGGRASPAVGVWTVAVLLTLGGSWLFRSAARAFRRKSFLGVVIPLGILVVVGTVGEIADILGTASGMSDLVGAVIVLLAAIPVVLLWPVRRQPNADARPGEPSFLGGFIKVVSRSGESK